MTKEYLIEECKKIFGYEFPLVLKSKKLYEYRCYFENGTIINFGKYYEKDSVNLFHSIKTYPIERFDFYEYCQEINKMIYSELYRKVDYSYFLIIHKELFNNNEYIYKLCTEFNDNLTFGELSLQMITDSINHKPLNENKRYTELLAINKINIPKIEIDESNYKTATFRDKANKDAKSKRKKKDKNDGFTQPELFE